MEQLGKIFDAPMGDLSRVSPLGLAVLITGALAAFLARPLSRGNGKRETLLRLGGLLLAMLGALVTMKVL